MLCFKIFLQRSHKSYQHLSYHQKKMVRSKIAECCFEASKKYRNLKLGGHGIQSSEGSFFKIGETTLISFPEELFQHTGTLSNIIVKAVNDCNMRDLLTEKGKEILTPNREQKIVGQFTTP
jgi:hypothetical protein